MNLFSLSLILICPLIRLIQLQSLRFEFSIGCIESNIRTSLFPISFYQICASASDSLFLSLAFSLNRRFSFLLKVDMKIFPFEFAHIPDLGLSFLSTKSLQNLKVTHHLAPVSCSWTADWCNPRILKSISPRQLSMCVPPSQSFLGKLE